MIRFVCGSCKERLSVPDPHAGKKAVCPMCGAVNRVPLKGFVQPQAQPQTPPVARSVEEQPRPVSVAQAVESKPPVSGRVAPPVPPIQAQPPAVKAPPQAPANSRPAPTLIFGDAPSAPVKPLRPARMESRPAKKRAPPPAPEPEAPNPFAVEYLPPAPAAAPERRLPRPVKIVLLILAAVLIVGGLYFALRFGVQALIRSLNGG